MPLILSFCSIGFPTNERCRTCREVATRKSPSVALHKESSGRTLFAQNLLSTTPTQKRGNPYMVSPDNSNAPGGYAVVAPRLENSCYKLGPLQPFETAGGTFGGTIPFVPVDLPLGRGNGAYARAFTVRGTADDSSADGPACAS